MGVVADACMRDGGGKEVGLRLQILRHKPAVGGAEATDVLGIDKRMLSAELLGAFDDVLRHALTGGIDMA